MYAKIINTDVKSGWIPLQDIGPNLLFGNFLGNNHNVIIYAQ